MPDIFVAKPERFSEKKIRKDKALSVVHRLDSNLTKLKKNSLSAFATFPKKVTFETQEAEEPIILMLRAHWVTNIFWISVSILMIILPFFAGYVPLLEILPSRFQIFFLILWYLFTLSFIFEKFLSWFFNIYLVTDERVVDVDFYSMIYKQISDAGLDKIQDITYKTGGLAGSVINFGNVFIQTAGSQPNIEFLKVPRPAAVVKILNELIVQEQQEMLDGRAR